MIRPINTRQVKKRSKVAQQAALQQTAQITLNAVLWLIIKQSADPEGEHPEDDGRLTIPMDELESVPGNFMLNVCHDPKAKTVVLTAAVKEEKSKIVLPDGSRLHD